MKKSCSSKIKIKSSLVKIISGSFSHVTWVSLVHFRLFGDRRQEQPHWRQKVKVAPVLRVIHRDLFVLPDDLSKAFHRDYLSRGQSLSVVMNQSHRDRNLQIAVGVV